MCVGLPSFCSLPLFFFLFFLKLLLYQNEGDFWSDWWFLRLVQHLGFWGLFFFFCHFAVIFCSMNIRYMKKSGLLFDNLFTSSCKACYKCNLIMGSLYC